MGWFSYCVPSLSCLKHLYIGVGMQNHLLHIMSITYLCFRIYYISSICASFCCSHFLKFRSCLHLVAWTELRSTLFWTPFQKQVLLMIIRKCVLFFYFTSAMSYKRYNCVLYLTNVVD